MKEVAYVCPKCGKHELLTEKPDEYEVWLKCPSCDFLMGMSTEDWHRIENGSGTDQKIKELVEGHS